MVDRDDDLRIGMKTSAITLGDKDIPAIMGFYVAYLGLWTWGLSDRIQGVAAGVAGLIAVLQVIWHFGLIRHRTREGCFQAFRMNHWLGLTVFVGVALGLPP